MSNKTHTKPHSKKKEGEQYYFREYKHPGHNGTKIGHTDWKHRGGMYFSKNEKYLIARVLDGTIDPMPWVESWPLKPLDFEPLIWGEPREIEDDQEAIDPPSLDDIEALELQHMALEDTRNRLETALETLDIQEKNIVLRTPSRSKPSKTIETVYKPYRTQLGISYTTTTLDSYDPRHRVDQTRHLRKR